MPDGRFAVSFENSYEFLAEPFEIATGVTLPVGSYDFNNAIVAFNMSQQFDTGLKGDVDAALLVKVSASTSNVEANMQGYTVRDG